MREKLRRFCYAMVLVLGGWMFSALSSPWMKESYTVQSKVAWTEYIVIMDEGIYSFSLSHEEVTPSWSIFRRMLDHDLDKWPQYYIRGDDSWKRTIRTHDGALIEEYGDGIDTLPRPVRRVLLQGRALAAREWGEKFLGK